MHAAPALQDRLTGAIYGLLIGDALGVPYEFHPPQELPPMDAIEMAPPPDFARAHPGAPAGTWSDDGAQALILLHSLLANDGFAAGHFANGLVNWYEHGFMTPDGIVFDVGVQTATAIRELRAGAAPLTAGGAGEYDNGNGSLMRVAPLALWSKADDVRLIADAFAQSSITHNHPRAKLCCALFCLWARAILAGAGPQDAWRAAIAALRAHIADGPLADEFEAHIAPEAERTPRGSGYVVDCLFSAHWALTGAHDYESAVKRAISLGYDTDTTACVTGALAGLHYGFDSIPLRWRETLRGQEVLAPLISRLLTAHSLH